MRMGVSLWANNGSDNERFSALERGEGEPIGDGVDNVIYETEIRFGDLVEPLGFDSIWTVEHHFSPYTMVPDPLQFLTFWAARTERIGMGTMVVVLPWHRPGARGRVGDMSGQMTSIPVNGGRRRARRRTGESVSQRDDLQHVRHADPKHPPTIAT